MGFGKPRLCTKFEVASFRDCVNIEGEPQILGSSLSPVLCLPFLLRVMWQTPYCVLNLKLLASAVAEILYANPTILRSSPSPRRLALFTLCMTYDGPWQSQAVYHI